MYLCTKFQSNTPILSKDIARKPFFKVENFSKLKRAITPKIIRRFYPKSNSLHLMIIYLCIKFQSHTPILSKDKHRNQKCYVRDGTDGRTDSGDTICPQVENGGGIMTLNEQLGRDLNITLKWPQKEQILTLVLLNPDIPYLCKQCRSRSVGFWRSQLIWICTVCH